MHSARGLLFAGGLWAAVSLCGCQNMPKFSDMKVPTMGEILHELSPHRLHRWNRHSPPPSTYNFSVDDPIPELQHSGRQPARVASK